MEPAPLASALVGMPGVSELSMEQRCRRAKSVKTLFAFIRPRLSSLESTDTIRSYLAAGAGADGAGGAGERAGKHPRRQRTRREAALQGAPDQLGC